VNRQIGRLFVLIVLLFFVLIGFSSRWSVFDAKALRDQPLNRRSILEEQQIPRGLILAGDGKTRLAINKRLGSRETRRYVRIYPTGGLFAHEVGYAFISDGSAGLERSQNDFLTGNENEFKSVIDQISGGKKQGDDLYTTLDPAGQREAISALAGRNGSIVALDPSTGAVKVMASVPGFDPNQVPTQFKRLNGKGNGSPLTNRSTQAGYPPGSTFKVVTAAAALDSGKYTPDSMINGKDNQVIGGVPLHNFGGETFGQVSLTDALTNSVNTVFGQIGESLGKSTMYKYMRRFGFNQKPQLDYPRDQMAASGVFGKGGKLLGPGDAVDIGRVAIGQERLLVTPLQMAEVAAAVGNGGKLMKPHFTDKVVAPDGRVRQTVSPQEQSTVMSSHAASQLATMMGNVVKSGTGTQAQLQGIQVAGKTGTAQVGGGTQAWFIAFAPIHNPKVAIAVTVERTQQSLTGGEVAAPLAARVLKVLLAGQHG
jgi:peptidoglycan glycosyltransferase